MTVRLPGEFEPHERTVICWPAREGLYGDRFADAEEAHAKVANEIVRFEPVAMLVNSHQVDRARTLCDPFVDVVPMEMDDAWFRDTGPIYVRDDSVESGRVATDWIFNGWGNKFNPHDKDATLAARWAEFNGDNVRSVSMVLEGGSINSNGAGLVATTSQCLLHPNRNPGFHAPEIAQMIATHLGASAILWLPYGLALDGDTDGHVDNVAAFADQETLVVQMCSDSSELDHERMRANRHTVDVFTENQIWPIKVIEIPVLPFVDTPNGRLVVPYLNFYVGNGFVLVPVCGHPADSQMLDLIGTAFPGREVIGLDVGEILAVGGGGIHCITQQIPKV